MTLVWMHVPTFLYPGWTWSQITRRMKYATSITSRIEADRIFAQHEWFKESRSSKTNPKRDWYVWRPPKYDENGTRQPPNNWKSFFQGTSPCSFPPCTHTEYFQDRPGNTTRRPTNTTSTYLSSSSQISTGTTPRLGKPSGKRCNSGSTGGATASA